LDSSKQTIRVYGERTDATRFDVENCVLEDGKVAPEPVGLRKAQPCSTAKKKYKNYFSPIRNVFLRSPSKKTLAMGRSTISDPLV
jgi:hypothetical protein